MALAHRIKNLTSYLRFSRMKAAIGLLSSDERHEWILTTGFPKLSDITADKTYPWYTLQSIKYIGTLINPDMKVLEYGSGYSTLWWAERVAEVTSIERSRDWYERLKAALAQKNYQNVKLIHFDKLQDEASSDVDGLSGQENLDSEVNKYIYAASPSPSSFDVVVVDDVQRNITVRHAIEFVKPGGILILDDSERPEYKPTVDTLSRLKWSFASFYGATPYHFVEKQTTLWFKPEEGK